MNNNRCISCGAIIPEGRQVCPNCERKAGIDRAITSVYTVTPENAFCLACKNKKCNGECKELREYLTGERKNRNVKRLRKSFTKNNN